MASIHVRFQGLPQTQTYIAKYCNIPGHDGLFHALPADATGLIIPETHSLFTNRWGDRRSREITLDQARTWGSADRHDTETIFVRANSATSRFCLRLVLNPKDVVRHKTSPQYAAYQRLLKDAKFHSNHLSEAEGSLVPRHYGIWVMETGDWAGQIMFGLTQWGGISWNELSYTRFNTEANRILVGRTFEALHDYGFDHGGLGWFENFRHVVIDLHAPGLSKDDRLNGNAPCYIVSFSEAQENHRCTRKLPILPLGSFLDQDEVGCPEIESTLILLGFMKESDNSIPVSELLSWHTKYSERHPNIPNLEVLLAQRAKFFPDMPPIYPNQTRITFHEDDEYAATLTILDSDEETEQTSGGRDTIVGVRPDSLTPATVEVATSKFQRMQLAHLLLD